mgnify:CR=1 FL=1
MDISRRELATLLALAGVEADAQTESSLYIPKAQNVEDRALIHDLMDEFSFADLVTAGPGVRITHVPTWLDRGAGKFGTIHGHVSRQNPQHKLFDGKQTAVMAFLAALVVWAVGLLADMISRLHSQPPWKP